MHFARVGNVLYSLDAEHWVYGAFDLHIFRTTPSSFAANLMHSIRPASADEVLLVGLGGGFMLPELLHMFDSVHVLEKSSRVIRGFETVVRPLLRRTCDTSLADRVHVHQGDAHHPLRWAHRTAHAVLDYDPCYKHGACGALERLGDGALQDAVAYVNRWRNDTHPSYAHWALVEVRPTAGQYLAIYVFRRPRHAHVPG